MLSKSVLVLFSIILQLHENVCLECYSCSNVTHVANCQSVIRCPSDHICHATVSSGVYTLGCKDSKLCHAIPTTTGSPGGGASIVGRSTPAGGSCSECCETGMCNRALCQNNYPLCQDSGHVDCAATGSYLNVCAEKDHAKSECRRFCGLCRIVDGGWTAWATWSACSATCGNGTTTRTRSCTDPAPANGGDDCTGPSLDTNTCSNDKCPVNGGWSTWSSWGSCSVTCGIGLRRRDRSCSHPYPSSSGLPCFGDARDDRVCHQSACQDGGWTVWGSWNSCLQTCDVCTQARSRSCTNPSPSILGRYCVGNNMDVKTILLKSCVDQDIGFTVNHPIDTGTAGHITFNNVISNNGGGYNTATGEFTCRIDGAYSFSLTILKDSSASLAQCSIYKDDIFLGKAHVHPGSTVSYVPASITVFVHLRSGDKVSLKDCTVATSLVKGYNYSTFTGYLIHKD